MYVGLALRQMQLKAIINTKASELTLLVLEARLEKALEKPNIWQRSPP